MIKTTINKSAVKLQVKGCFKEIYAEYCLLGRLIAETFAKHDKKLVEVFENGIKELADKHVFSCMDEELDEKMGAAEGAAEEEQEDDLTKLAGSLEELKKTLEDLKNATK